MKIQKSTIDSDYKLVIYDSGVEYIVYFSASWLVGATHDKMGTLLKNEFFPAENGGYIAWTKISNEICLSEGEEVTIKGKNWDRSLPAIIRRRYKNGNVTVFISSTRETVKLTPKNFHDFYITAIRWFKNTKKKTESQDIKTEYFIRGDKGDFYSTTYEGESCYDVALGVKGITWAKRSSAERNLDLARKIDPTCAIFSR